jgi:hypothetical protein
MTTEGGVRKPTDTAGALGYSEDEETLRLVFTLGRKGEEWCARVFSSELKAEAIYTGAPNRLAALSTGLVMLARMLLEQQALPDSHEASFERLLQVAMEEYDDLLYPEPTFEEKLEGMRERQAAALAKEQAEDRAENGPEPSFHGEHFD